MILFKPEHVQPTLTRRKTQTRRVGKRRWNVGAVHQQCRTQLYGQPFARIRILGVYHKLLRPTQVPTIIMNGPPLCPECQRMADENEVATDERRGA